MKKNSRVARTAVAALVGILGPSALGCGESLHDDPVNAPYVAPEAPGEMKPESKKNRMQRQQTGVPLSFLTAPAPVIDQSPSRA